MKDKKVEKNENLKDKLQKKSDLDGKPDESGPKGEKIDIWKDF